MPRDSLPKPRCCCTWKIVYNVCVYIYSWLSMETANGLVERRCVNFGDIQAVLETGGNNCVCVCAQMRRDETGFRSGV